MAIKSFCTLRERASVTGTLIVEPLQKVSADQQQTQSSEHEVERSVDHELQADSNLLQLLNVTPKKIVASSSRQVKRLCLITPTKIPWSKKVKLSSTPKQGVKRPVQATIPQNWQSRMKPKKMRTPSSRRSPVKILIKVSIN